MGRMMKKRIFAGSICEQIVYMAPDRAGGSWNPEKETKRERFKDEAEYIRFKTEIKRRAHYRKFMANFRAGDLFSTLTFDRENEVTDFTEARAMRNKWRRKIRRAFPEAVFFLYMGRGKSTHRIHFHMVSHGIPEEWIRENWCWGKADRIVMLRKKCRMDGVDMGMDYQGLANYLFDHWSQEQGGHRYFATRNARQPEEEKATEIRLKYAYSQKRPPRAPKGYRMTKCESIGYGLWYFRYVLIEEKTTAGRPVDGAL